MLAASALTFGYFVIWYLFNVILKNGGLAHWQEMPAESYLISCTVLMMCGVVVLLFRALEDHRRMVMAEQYDQETELPNAIYLKRHIEKLARKKNAGPRGGLVAVGIDGLASINVAYGYGVGNQVIREISERLRMHIDSGSTLVRLSGDTFAVYAPHAETAAQLRKIADNAFKATEPAVAVGDLSTFISFTIGATLDTGSQPSIDDYVRQAELSLLHARTEPDKSLIIYSDELAASAQRLGEIEIGLREALELGQIEVHYQTLLDGDAGHTVGVEALVRWSHPVLGPISPSEFVPIAESIGLHEKLDSVVLWRACKEIKPLADLVLAVNICANHLLHPSFLRDLEHILHTTGFEPSRLEIEVTESVFMRLPDKVRAVTEELRKRGISVVLDDFGTGYSSLSYLKNFEVDRIKVDASFTRSLGASQKAEDIFRSINDLAKLSGAEVTVEGIENATQLEFLRQFTGFWFQGFLFSKPISYVDLLQSDLLRKSAQSDSASDDDRSMIPVLEKRIAAV